MVIGVGVGVGLDISIGIGIGIGEQENRRRSRKPIVSIREHATDTGDGTLANRFIRYEKHLQNIAGMCSGSGKWGYMNEYIVAGSDWREREA